MKILSSETEEFNKFANWIQGNPRYTTLYAYSDYSPQMYYVDFSITITWNTTAPYIYNGTKWVEATPYVFNGTKWVPATVSIYNNGWS